MGKYNYRRSFRLILPDDPRYYPKTYRNVKTFCRYEQFNSTKISKDEVNHLLIHQKGDYLISTHQLPFRSSQECPNCGVIQPFRDWCCAVCGGNSIAGEPHDESEFNKDFDEVFASLTVSDAFEYLGQSKKFKNHIYKRNLKTS